VGMSSHGFPVILFTIIWPANDHCRSCSGEGFHGCFPPGIDSILSQSLHSHLLNVILSLFRPSFFSSSSLGCASDSAMIGRAKKTAALRENPVVRLDA
jgi:hypothetical protein